MLMTAQITSHNLSSLPLCSRGAGTPAQPHSGTAAELQPGLNQAKCSTVMVWAGLATEMNDRFVSVVDVKYLQHLLQGYSNRGAAP